MTRTPHRGPLRAVVAGGAAILAAFAALSPAPAAIIDLTTAGSSGTIGAAKFDTNVVQATGTGGFDTFVQQSPPNANSDSSRAYNTTTNNVLDNKSADNFNYSILLGDVPVQNVGGVPHLKFSLDINESNAANEMGAEFISLDEVQLFVGGTANSSVDTFDGSGRLEHDGLLVFRLDDGVDNWVAMNADLNAGSGSGDVDMLLPKSLFAAFADSDIVTLYSQFGLQGLNPAGFTGNFGASGGFEEWGLTSGVPEPTAVLLLAVAAAGRLRLRRR